jgi:hypothetical protein
MSEIPMVQSSKARDEVSLVKSRKRVVDHGEVFTPSWMVEEMLDLVKDESERIDSRFLEPACIREKWTYKGLDYNEINFEKDV